MASPLTTASPSGPPSSSASPRARGHPTLGPVTAVPSSLAVATQAAYGPSPSPHPKPQSHSHTSYPPPHSLSHAHVHAHASSFGSSYPPPPQPQPPMSHASHSYYHHHGATPTPAPAFTAVVPPPSHSHSLVSFSQRPLTLNPTSTTAAYHPHPHHPTAAAPGAPPPPGHQLHHHHHHYSYPPHLDPADASVLSGPPAQTTRFLAANWHSARTAALNLDASGKGSQAPVQRTPQTLKRHDFVQALVATAAEIIDALYPTPPTVVIPLPTFIAEILRRSKSSFSTLQLALFYLFKYRAAFMRRMAHEAATRSAMQAGAAAAAAAAKETDSALPSPPTVDASPPLSPTLAAATGQDPPEPPSSTTAAPGSSSAPGVRSLATCGRRLFLAALILAAKYLQDKNYSNKAWAKISGLTALEINRNEREFLDTMDYGLFVSAAKFARWSALLVSHINAVHHARQEQLAQAQHKQQKHRSASTQQQQHPATGAVPTVSTPVVSRPASRMSSATPPPVSAIVTHKAILAFDFLPPQAAATTTSTGAPTVSSSNGSRPISRAVSPASSHAPRPGHMGPPATSASSASSPLAAGTADTDVSGHASPSSTSTQASRRPPPLAHAAGTPYAPPHIPVAGHPLSVGGSPSTMVVSGAPHMAYMSHSMMATAVNLRDSLPRHMRARPATETLSPENKDSSGSTHHGSPATPGVPASAGATATPPTGPLPAGGTVPVTSLGLTGGHNSTTPVMPPPSAEATRTHHGMHSGGTVTALSNSGGAGGSGSADRVAAIMHAFPDDEFAPSFDYHHHAHPGHPQVHGLVHGHSMHNTPSSAGSAGSASASGYLHATGHFAHSESAASLVSDVAGGLPAVVVPFDAVRHPPHQETSASEGEADAMQGVVSGTGASRKRGMGEVGDDSTAHPAAKRQRPSSDTRFTHIPPPPAQSAYPAPVSHAAAVYASSTSPVPPPPAAIVPPTAPADEAPASTTPSDSASATWTGLSSVHLATYAPPPITPGTYAAAPSRFADLLRMRAAQASGMGAAANAVSPGHALGGPLSAALASANAGQPGKSTAATQGSEAARRYHAPGPAEPPDQAYGQQPPSRRS